MKFDVFLSHNGKDKPAVETLAHKLEAKGFKVWLDKWNLIPGEPWQEGLEEALDVSQTYAVFVGPSGIGPWENEEMRVALEERVRDKARRVIPVLLPGAPDNSNLKLPRFLTRLSWVDFRSGLNDQESLHRLESGIKGVAPRALSWGSDMKSIDQSLNIIIKKHSTWLNSKGEEGDQAVLSGMDLTNIDLSDVNLSQAIFRGTNLSGADLSRSNLSRTVLVEANLTNTNLRKANLSNSELTRAKLTNANVDGTNFAQCSLSDTIDLLLTKNLDKAVVSGKIWLEAKTVADKFSGDALAVRPIWKTREYNQDPNLCFVIMPFSNDSPYKYTQDVYQGYVKPLIARFDLNCLRADNIFGPTSIMEDIWEHILKSRLLIADVTGRNPNVFYELGMAHTLGRQVVVITQSDDDVPFDIRHFRYLKYQPTPAGLKEFESQLSKHIASIVQRIPKT